MLTFEEFNEMLKDPHSPACYTALQSHPYETVVHWYLACTLYIQQKKSDAMSTLAEASTMSDCTTDSSVSKVDQLARRREQYRAAKARMSPEEALFKRRRVNERVKARYHRDEAFKASRLREAKQRRLAKAVKPQPAEEEAQVEPVVKEEPVASTPAPPVPEVASPEPAAPARPRRSRRTAAAACTAAGSPPA